MISRDFLRQDRIRLLACVLAGVVLVLLFMTPPVQAADRRLIADLFSSSFPTEKEGWACGRYGTIQHTTDGGMTWQAQMSNTRYTLMSIVFTDPQNGWTAGDGGMILHTRDGGKTWHRQNSPVKMYFMGIYFANSQTGWIVGEKTTILHTKDGGATWVVQFQDQDFILKKISFADEMNGWAVGEYGYIYHTVDGGKTWQKQAGDFRFLPESGEIEGGTFLFDVKAVDPKNAWVVGIDGYVAKTSDGGKTWQTVTKGVPRTHLFGINTDGRDTVLIAGRGVLLASSDGGQSFKEINMKPTIMYGWLYNVAPRGKAGFVTVGKDGWVFVSDPKGESWKKAAN